MIVYLAGPIEMIRDGDYINETEWRLLCADALASSGHTAYNPVTAWAGVTEDIWQGVRKINRLALKNADGLLAGFPNGNYGFETIREIEACEPGVRRMAWGPKPHSMGTLDIYWHKTWEESISFI